jgi:hypothetical protein
VPVTAKNLTYCKMYNDKPSCCDHNTDADIGSFFATYKTAVAGMASVKMAGFKKVFNDYEAVRIAGQDNDAI